MSQFALCVVSDGRDSHVLRPVTRNVSMFTRAALQLFGGLEKGEVPSLSPDVPFERVADEAYNAVHSDGSFEGTALYGLLRTLLMDCDDVALWWSEDWENLPIHYDDQAFLDAVGQQLAEPMGEVYCRWQRASSSEQKLS